MSLKTLHDRARNLGLGAMYERHWANDFRDLFDGGSSAWAATDAAEKVIALKAFEAAGLPVAEIIEHHRERSSSAKASPTPAR